MGVDQEMEEAYDCLVVAVSCHWDQIHSYMVDLGPLRLSDRSWDPPRVAWGVEDRASWTWYVDVAWPKSYWRNDHTSCS